MAMPVDKGLWYFAHPNTVKDDDGNYVPAGEEANFRLCNWRAGQLLLRGYNVYSPISHTHPIHMACSEFLAKHEHDLWYDLDMHFLIHCKFAGLILSPGWEASRGCQMERDWFLAKGLPIMTYEEAINED